VQIADFKPDAGRQRPLHSEICNLHSEIASLVGSLSRTRRNRNNRF